MPGPDIVEVPPVDRGDRGDVQPLSQGDKRGIGATEPTVGLTAHQFSHPANVLVEQPHQLKVIADAYAHRVEERCLRHRSKLTVNEVTGFGQDGHWYHQPIHDRSEPGTTPRMLAI